MAKYSNRQILAAVLNKWAQPAIQQLTIQRVDKIPGVAYVEEWVRSTGVVSRQWRISHELPPFMKSLSSVIEPILSSLFTKIPDEVLPILAHHIVDEAIKNGGWKPLEGFVEFEVEDLEELKKLLRYNLPIAEYNSYEVITEEPNPQGEESAE